MRLDAILQAGRLSPRIVALTRAPANDNLTFADRVRADIAEAARAAGVSYSERELRVFAADAMKLVERLGR